MSAAINNSVINHWNDILKHNDLTSLDQSQKPSEKLADFVEWLENIGASTSLDFTWKTANSYDFKLRGNIGDVVLGAKTLGEALDFLTKYFPLIQDDSSLQLRTNEKWACLSYKILDPNIWPRHHDALYSLGVYATLIKLAEPKMWSQVEMSFEAPAHLYNDDLSKIVNARCIFECEENAIYFPEKLLDHPLRLQPAANSHKIEQLNEALRLKHKNTPTYNHVRNYIIQNLHSGTVSQAEIASYLGITTRTLRRHLARHGYKFQTLLDKCRMEIVELEIKSNKKTSLSEIAFKLGYSEHSTFSRAFSKWTGMPPHAFRNALLQNS